MHKYVLVLLPVFTAGKTRCWVKFVIFNPTNHFFPDHKKWQKGIHAGPVVE